MYTLRRNAKAIATLISGIAVALVVNGFSGPWETELEVITVIAGAVITWAAPYEPKR